MRTASVVTLCALCACCFASALRADSFGHSVVNATKPALIGVIGVAYISSKDHGFRDAARTGEAMVVSYGLAHALQETLVVNDESTFKHSFPSKRTAVAFAAATSLSDIYPKHKWAAYAGASLIGWSTVSVGGHKWTDVLAGAALGMAVGKWSVATPDGLIVGRVFNF